MPNPEEKEKAANVGITQSLGDSELEILHILWNRGEGTVRQVYDEIRRKRNITLPAVMLSMDRLAKRGVLQKLAGDRAAIYKPYISLIHSNDRRCQRRSARSGARTRAAFDMPCMLFDDYQQRVRHHC